MGIREALFINTGETLTPEEVQNRKDYTVVKANLQCVTENCNASIIIVNREPAHFRSKPLEIHLDGCPYEINRKYGNKVTISYTEDTVLTDEEILKRLLSYHRDDTEKKPDKSGKNGGKSGVSLVSPGNKGTDGAGTTVVGLKGTTSGESTPRDETKKTRGPNINRRKMNQLTKQDVGETRSVSGTALKMKFKNGSENAEITLEHAGIKNTIVLPNSFFAQVSSVNVRDFLYMLRDYINSGVKPVLKCMVEVREIDDEIVLFMYKDKAIIIDGKPLDRFAVLYQRNAF